MARRRDRAQPDAQGDRPVAVGPAVPGAGEHGGVQVSGPEEMIADALREIAAQAGAPRPMADAAWRAGRRRRLAALTASAVAGAAAIVAAVLLLPLAAHGQPPSRPPSQQELAPVSLRSPIQFRQVAAISNASCPAGSRGLPGSLPGSTAPACFYLTGTGMTVTALQSAQVVPSGTGGYQLEHRPHPGPDGPVCGPDPAGLRPAQPSQPGRDHHRRARDRRSRGAKRDPRRQCPDHGPHPGPGGKPPGIPAEPLTPPPRPGSVALGHHEVLRLIPAG